MLGGADTDITLRDRILTLGDLFETFIRSHDYVSATEITDLAVIRVSE